MDAAVKDKDKLHRVKRAYVRKPVKEANVRLEGADVGVQYDDEIAVPHPVNVERVNASQAYAMRVWSGQSADLPLSERKARVIAALVGQNIPTDGLTFTPEGIA